MTTTVIAPGLDRLGFDDFELRETALQTLNDQIAVAPVDTREALATFVPYADPFQQKVIDARHETIRVVAPAGSGKTQTVINRVLRRVGEGLNPSRMLVLTFDNAAALSLKAKLRDQLDRLSTNMDGLAISTLNAFGYRILREYARHEAKPVVSDDRQRRIFWEVKHSLRQRSPERFAALPTHLDDRFYLSFFSLLKNELIDPRLPSAQRVADFMLGHRQAQPFFEDPGNRDSVYRVIQALSWLYAAYELVLKRDELIDYDDQKLRAYTVLMDAPALRSSLQAKFDEVIVDEFQDINHLDFVLIQTIAERSSLVVMGDDDQAIYGFRGCSPEYIINLEGHLERPVTSFELQTNYRCPVNIVEHADRLIRHNRLRIPKTPVAEKRTPGQITMMSSLSPGLEARAIVTYIKRVIDATPGLGYNDFAVLYRTNAQSLPLQVEFILNDLPYFVRPEDNILRNDALGRLLTVLRAKQVLESGEQPSASDAVDTVKAYFRFVSEADGDRLTSLFRERRNFLEAIRSESFYAILPKAKGSQFLGAMDQVLAAENLMEAFDILARRFRGLRSMVASLEDAMDESAPLAEIYEIAANFRGNMREFTTMMERALERARSSGAGNQADDGVQLRTYFRSKGLQWHTVILTTCNDKIIPHQKSPLEDERRLFYVAMTRASSNLLISYVKNACKTSVAPSRFLQEAGLL